MNEPTPSNLPPGTIPPPPQALNLKILWLSLLLPPAITAVGMTIVAIFPDDVNEAFFQVGCGLVCLAAIAGWVMFILVIIPRFRGASLVLLILAYPVLQSILVFAIIFVGGVVALSHSEWPN